MTQRTLITLICDGCGKESEDVKTRSQLLNSKKGKPVDVEACDECWKPVEALLTAARPA